MIDFIAIACPATLTSHRVMHVTMTVHVLSLQRGPIPVRIPVVGLEVLIRFVSIPPTC